MTNEPAARALDRSARPADGPLGGWEVLSAVVGVAACAAWVLAR